MQTDIIPLEAIVVPTQEVILYSARRPTFDTVLTQLLPLLDEARAKFKAAGGTNLAPFRAARRPSRDAPDNNGTGG